jgi:hypothetical protein
MNDMTKFRVCVFVLVTFIIGMVVICFSNAWVHLAIGSYGVQIQGRLGYETDFILGSWWQGYEALESVVTNWMILGYVLGLSAGTIGTFTIMRKTKIPNNT